VRRKLVSGGKNSNRIAIQFAFNSQLESNEEDAKARVRLDYLLCCFVDTENSFSTIDGHRDGLKCSRKIARSMKLADESAWRVDVATARKLLSPTSGCLPRVNTQKTE
jgi:hypothetical protein